MLAVGLLGDLFVQEFDEDRESPDADRREDLGQELADQLPGQVDIPSAGDAEPDQSAAPDAGPDGVSTGRGD